MLIKELEDKISEYAQRISDIAEENGFSVLLNHTLLENTTGTMLSGWVCTIQDKRDIAYASVTQTTYTRLSFIDNIK